MAGNTKNCLIISKLFALWSKITGTCNLFSLLNLPPVLAVLLLASSRAFSIIGDLQEFVKLLPGV